MQLEAALLEFLPIPQADPAAEAVRRWLLDHVRDDYLDVSRIIPNRDATRRAMRDAAIRAATVFYPGKKPHGIAVALKLALSKFAIGDLYSCPQEYVGTINECLWHIATNIDEIPCIRLFERAIAATKV